MPVVNNTNAPLGVSTRASAVAEELRRLILSGELKAGERLRQAEVAERFNVSTTPVREAFSALSRQGLVRHDVHRGVVVFTPTSRDVKENYEIRMALEPLATELAAKNISGRDLARLGNLLDQMGRAKRVLEYQPLNREFHRTIYAAADRPRLYEIIESLRDSAEAYIAYDAASRPDPAYSEAAHREHVAIAEALGNHASKRARKLMFEHLSHNAEHIETSVELAAGHTEGSQL